MVEIRIMHVEFERLTSCIGALYMLVGDFSFVSIVDVLPRFLLAGGTRVLPQDRGPRDRKKR